MRPLHLGAAMLALAGSLATPPPAAAFEALTAALSRLPPSAADDGDGWLFGFVAPRTVRDWPLADHPGAGDDINRAFIDPGAAQEQTGIDFPALDAILGYGAPPATVTFVGGPEIDPQAVAAALTARGLEVETEAGIPVYWSGEDFNLDFAAREPANPFGGNLGMS